MTSQLPAPAVSTVLAAALAEEDRAALADALRQMLAERHDFARRRAQLAVAADVRPAIFDDLVGLGLNGLLLPEEFGGVGGGLADLQGVLRECGRALVVAPWTDTVLASCALLIAGSAAQQAAWLPGIASGAHAFALAHEDAAGLGAAPAATVARRQADGSWSIDGVKAAVAHAASVSHYLVAARLPVVAGAGIATGWFRVAARQTGIAAACTRMVDGSWCADLRLSGATAELLGEPGACSDLSGVLEALVVACATAEAVGLAEAALELTVQYLRTRKQFGQVLGDYQALRHRVAEMAILLEQARSGAELALEAARDESPVARARLLAQAQLVSAEAVTWITQQGIQLHGGMGMTDEMAIGHYYRRMLVLNARSGGAQQALARLAALPPA